MDNLVICDRCGSDACYVTEVNETIKNHFCYGCGFQSSTVMTADSEFLKEQMETLPNLYKELMGEDESGKVWMPTSVNVPSQGMVFANGKNSSNWKWAAVKAIPVKEEEKTTPLVNKVLPLYNLAVPPTGSAPAAAFPLA